MNAELFKKIAPKAYYGKYLEQDIRPDGRDIDEGRGIIISDAHINTADGSCFVRLGDTAVICGLKLEINNQREVNTCEGDIDVSVTLSPLSNPKFFLGKPTSQARFYSEALKNLFKKYAKPKRHDCRRYVLSLDELYVPDIRKVLKLHADLIVIDYEGSVFDACCLALLGSIMTLRIPTYTLKNDDIVIDREHFKRATISDIPISITFGLFDDFEVMDPDVFEEDIIEDSVSVILGTNNRIISINKPGGKAISDEMLNTMRDKARERYNDIYAKIEEFRDTLSY